MTALIIELPVKVGALAVELTQYVRLKKGLNMCRQYAWRRIKSVGNTSGGEKETSGIEAGCSAMPGVQIGESYIEPIARFMVQTQQRRMTEARRRCRISD